VVGRGKGVPKDLGRTKNAAIRKEDEEEAGLPSPLPGKGVKVLKTAKTIGKMARCPVVSSGNEAARESRG